MNLTSLHIPLIGLALAPILPGIINRVKAFFAGRKGPPLLQLYFDLFKLLRKIPTYSTTTTWVFRAGPLIGLASLITALFLTPLGNAPALLAFPGDVVLLAYLLGLMRFFAHFRWLQHGHLALYALYIALAALILVIVEL